MEFILNNSASITLMEYKEISLETFHVAHATELRSLFEAFFKNSPYVVSPITQVQLLILPNGNIYAKSQRGK